MHQKSYLAGLIGNILEHYDTALFGLLAPFIAPLFFHGQDPFTALILTYAMIPLGMITRPLGSLILGQIADRYGRRHAMCWSLSGMAAVTTAMGFLPTSLEVGPLAPLLLALLRLIQSFFSAGETSGGAIYILEHTPTAKRSLMSSLFDSSTIIGILIASGLVTLLSSQNLIETGWRYLFWAGGTTAFIGIFLRLKTEESPEFKAKPKKHQLKDFYPYRKAFFAIALAAGFSYTTYSVAFTLMNGYIPLVTSLTKIDLMKMNTALLCLDLVSLPFFGYLAHRFGKKKFMLFGALACCIGTIPLFSLLSSSSSLLLVTFIRMFIILSGVAFAAPYHAWALEQVPPHVRSTILCLSYTLGSQLIGSPTATICLSFYKQIGWIGAPSLYLTLVACCGLIALQLARKKTTVTTV